MTTREDVASSNHPKHCSLDVQQSLYCGLYCFTGKFTARIPELKKRDEKGKHQKEERLLMQVVTTRNVAVHLLRRAAATVDIYAFDFFLPLVCREQICP